MRKSCANPGLVGTVHDKILPISFYLRPTKKVAIELLGKILVHNDREGLTAGRIVETEAYMGKEDPGSHLAKGVTPRNQVMLEQGGKTYVYFCYGNHNLFNIVTEKEGNGGAVLIRALEPVCGIELMKKRRKNNGKNLTNGPGKLTEAMRLTLDMNSFDITRSRLKLFYPDKKNSFKVVRTKRIGIKEGADKILRFYIKGNSFVSVK